MALEAGARVGDYEISSMLGAGGMGQVYRVRNVISGRVEAMKVLPPDFAADTDSALRFTAEIRTLAALDHPNIAQLRTAFQTENRLVMIMELVEGTTLERRMGSLPLSVADAVDYTKQLLGALSYAHSKGVIHRDIKPANIMITPQGLVKLMDFGIAKSSQDPLHTQPGMTLGSVYYMPPEQVRGGNVDARSDIYSLGVTLYQMLTGRRPFQADTAYSVLNAQLNEIPASPAEFNPNLSSSISQIVLQAMAKAPEQRFQTAEAFRSALISTEGSVPRSTSTDAFAAATSTLPDAARPGLPPPSPGANIPPPILTPQVLASRSSGNRGLWLGLGAVAAIIALFAAATLLPRFSKTHADQRVTSVETPAVSPSPSSQSPAVTSTSAQDSPPSPPPAIAASQPELPTQASPMTKAPPPTTAAHRATTASPATIAPAQPSPAAEPSSAAPTQQEISAARNRSIQIGARADAVNAGIQALRSQQQADGLDLRGDILGSMNRMNAYIHEANFALNQTDLQAANDDMERAEKELSTLEKFLGR